jgi:hypothetical protein
LRFRQFILLLTLVAVRTALSEGLLPRLSESQVRQTRKILEGFKANPKGPYFQIRWFCKDGSVHPPAGTPCAARGGGTQHATLSPAAEQLAKWNLDVGTILAALNYEQFLDAGRDHHRLKQLVLERYLAEIDDGWIYRRAAGYRGARQIEDEERAGRRFLLQLLAMPQWTSRSYFLANQAVMTVPHGTADGTVRRIRTLSSTIAAQDARFQRIRAKIHSMPGPEDVADVERFAVQRDLSPAVAANLSTLADLMRRQRITRGLEESLRVASAQNAGQPIAPLIESMRAAVARGDANTIFSAGAALSAAIWQEVTTSTVPARNLDLLDLNVLIQEKGFETARAPEQATRAGLVANLLDHLRYVLGAGLLSKRQFDALDRELRSLSNGASISAQQYHAVIAYVAHSPEWCRTAAARDFAPLVDLYEPVEPKARALLDHLVRGSVALPLSARIERLMGDANRAVGIRHAILGQSSNRGVAALNPGVAMGRLEFLRPEQEEVDPRAIYVVPETASDLKPVAGILSLDTGNALSHAQLLAANLGIPNASVPSSLLPALEKHRGVELFFAVTPRGVVFLREKNSLTPAELKVWERQPITLRRRIQLDGSRVKLDDKALRKLTEVSTADTGVIAGPKATNLGELARRFPGKVANGFVIPFGIYSDHIQRALDSTGVPLDRQIRDAYAQAERLRDTGAAPAEISRFIYPRLAQFRQTIEEMPLLAAFEKALVARLLEEFGPDGGYGVFVRSDTNAEDLPEFTGAGLNRTVPNVVGARNILRAVKQVWASPFTERAYDWRSRILSGHDRIYPSVIVMRAVPSDKSGVIATMNLETGNPDETTVNINEGVSAVVDGGTAESLLLGPGGQVRLLEQARATYRRVLLPTGGFENRPPLSPEFLLAPEEIEQIRMLVADVKSKYPPARSQRGVPLPWDIEFGFVNGQLRLFQIRPLARYQEIETLEALGGLESRESPQPVSMNARP